MSLRSGRQRLHQAFCYELGSWFLIGPVYLIFFGHSAAQSVRVMGAVLVVCVLWSPLHNLLFDRLEWRLWHRLASGRPLCWRLTHALSHEGTLIVMTVPIFMGLGGHGLWQAVGIDLTLTMIGLCYVFGFHLIYDRWNPVQTVGPIIGNACLASGPDLDS